MRYASGDLIDERYAVHSLLGSGGMAEVYRAVDTRHGQEVVVKLPHASIAGDMAAFNRYRREIEIGTRLDHPGIQRLLSDDRTPYMVLEYVDGQTLRQYLRAGHPLPVDRVVDLVAQVCATLEYVHAQGIVHRDLKPDNIMVQPDGQVRLMDFGISLRLASKRLTFNHLSNAVGTPDYMAPEQVRGERGDVRTDVYALGVVLFELLTGHIPYPSHDALDAMQRKVQTDPPLVRRLRPEVPEALQAVVYRSLRRRPEERYPSVAELKRDLCGLDQVSIPVYAPDVPPPKPPGDLPPWRTTGAIMAAILIVLLILGSTAELLHRGLPGR